MWEKLIYTNNSSLLEFKNYYEDKFKTIINIIMFNNEIIYITDIDEENLNKNIKYEIINNIEEQITVSMNSIDYLELPNIIIIL